MLVLSRKPEEALIINDDIEIKIIEIVGDKVRIGVEAPKNYKIMRKELLQTVQSNQQAAKPVYSKDLMSFIAGLNNGSEE